MRARPPIPRRHVAWLRRLAFVLALLAQGVGALTAVAEGRAGRGAGAHIEGPGSTGHYVHDESLCVACHVRSMHGRTASALRLEPLAQEIERHVAPRRVRAASADLTFDHRSRAPPVVS